MSYDVWGGSLASAAMLLTAGGNPDANVEITTNSVGAPTGAGATAIKNDFTTSGVVLEGSPFTLSLDVSNGLGSFGNGQQIDLLVEQDGNIYGFHVGPTLIGLNPPAFYNVSFSGTLEASGFTLRVGGGPSTPDFSGATATRFGFGGFNRSTPALTQN